MFTPEALAGYVSLALLTLVNLLVSYFVLKRFLFQPILKLLRKRRETVAQQMDQARDSLSKAETRMAEAGQRLDDSSHEASEIIATARRQAEQQSEQILTEARTEAKNIIDRAENEVARKRLAMLNDVRDEVADLSVAIASKVIGHAMDEQQQRALVEQYVSAESRLAGDDDRYGNGDESR